MRVEGNPKPQYANVPAEDKQAAYSKAYYEKNKEARREDSKARSAVFRAENKEEAKRRASAHWHSKSPEEKERLGAERRLKGRFKRSTEWYNETLKLQGGHCALCIVVPTDRRLHVDHDHACCPCIDTRYTCGKCVRGLLCDGCNTRIGYLEGLLKEADPFVPKEGTWTSLALQYLTQYDTERCGGTR